MQKKIAFYISDYNMEHVLRTIPILQNMLKMEENLAIFLKSGKKQIQMVKEWVEERNRIHFYEMEMKDEDKSCWEEMSDAEAVFLKNNQIGLIISDICPWIFLAADDLRIKSLLIANYTWAELCETEEDREDYLSCYELASRIFIYDFHRPELTGYGVEYELMSMINRFYDMNRIESIREQMGEQIVFVDLPKVKLETSSGMEKEGKTIDVSRFPYQFVITAETPFSGDNVIVLTEGEKERHNYVAASKFVIADVSWNAIAEVVLSNKKAAFAVKEKLSSSRWMLDLLKERGQCIELRRDMWLDMESLLNELENFCYSYDHEYYNSDYDMAKQIIFAYPEKRRRNRS